MHGSPRPILLLGSPHGFNGKTPELLIDVARLEREYFERTPDMADPAQRVAFGTSGHRGSSLRGSFVEARILAITQAICDYRRTQRFDGPLYVGKDTHALSAPAQRTALEVLAANDIDTIIQRDDGLSGAREKGGKVPSRKSSLPSRRHTGSIPPPIDTRCLPARSADAGNGWT